MLRCDVELIKKEIIEDVSESMWNLLRRKSLNMMCQNLIQVVAGVPKKYIGKPKWKLRINERLAHAGVEPTTFALIARRSNQLS